MKLHQIITEEDQLDEDVADYARAIGSKLGAAKAAIGRKIAGSGVKDDNAFKGGNAQIGKEMETMVTRTLADINKQVGILTQKLTRQNTQPKVIGQELSKMMDTFVQSLVKKYRGGKALEGTFQAAKLATFIHEHVGLVNKYKDALITIYLDPKDSNAAKVKYGTDFEQRMVSLQRLIDTGAKAPIAAAKKTKKTKLPPVPPTPVPPTPPGPDPTTTAVVKNGNEYAKGWLKDFSDYIAAGKLPTPAMKKAIAKLYADAIGGRP